jgi:neutral ceramidase
MAGWKAGTASVMITPDEPLWLAGYAGRTGPAEDKISDLFVRALALEDPAGERLVIISSELIGITRILAEPVAAAVEAATRLPRQRLLLAATHTHYAPEYRPEKQVFFEIPAALGGKLLPTARWLADSIAQAAIAAQQQLEPVRLYARMARAGFAHNRRRAASSSTHAIFSKGLRGPAPTEDTFDHDVPVLDAIDARGRHRAVVFGYACHCTTIPLEDQRYCGDWAGFAAERIEQGHPGSTALFIAGAGADQNPEPRGSVELSRQYGRELADAVLGALDGAGEEIVGGLRAAMEEISLPLQPVNREMLDAMVRSDDPPQRAKAGFLLEQIERGEALITSYPVPLQAVRFGEQMLMIAMSGEPVVDWAHRFRRDFAAEAPRIWVAGYCNDMFGYVPTRRIQQEGGYEGGRAFLWNSIPAPFTDAAEGLIADAIGRLVQRVSRDQR